MRPEVVAYLAVSLDGFIARPDGSLDWLDAFQVSGEDYGYAEFFRQVDAVLLGRATYDAVVRFEAWPFAGKRVVVLTHRTITASHGETTYSGELKPLLQQMVEAGVRRIYLDGGAAVRQGLSEDVVDELTLSWIPQLLGSGRPLFGSGGLPGSAWTLAAAKCFAVGLVQCRYRRAR